MKLLRYEHKRLGLALLASVLLNLLILVSIAASAASQSVDRIRQAKESRELRVSLPVPAEVAGTPDRRDGPEEAPPALSSELVARHKDSTEAELQRAVDDNAPRSSIATPEPSTPTKAPAGDIPRIELIRSHGSSLEKEETLMPVAIGRDEFLIILQDLITERLKYPGRARQRGTEGTVVVHLVISRTGELVEYGIEEGSGSSTLDRAAVSLLESIFPVAHPPERELECTVAVAYRLR